MTKDIKKERRPNMEKKTFTLAVIGCGGFANWFMPLFKALPNGHMGSHKFLVDDFLKAVDQNKQPVLNAWRAARYTVPGLVAIESAKQGGIPLEVPDFGEYKE